MTVWRAIGIILLGFVPFLLVMSPTIFMLVWGVHHLPKWWYDLPGLPWVTRFDRQVAAVVVVFFASCLISLPIRWLCEDIFGWPPKDD